MLEHSRQIIQFPQFDVMVIPLRYWVLLNIVWNHLISQSNVINLAHAVVNYRHATKDAYYSHRAIFINRNIFSVMETKLNILVINVRLQLPNLHF